MTIGDGAAKFGKENWDIGQTGELRFRTAAAADVRTRDVPIYHSLPGDLTGQLETDLDICMVAGQVMFLIDVKLWSASSAMGRAIYWTMPGTGWPMRGCLPLFKHRKSGELRLSQNMAIVHKSYSGTFLAVDSDLLIVSLVVFVSPGANGTPNVSGMNFPGSVPSYTLEAALDLIASTVELQSSEANPAVLRELSKLAGVSDGEEVDYSERRALPSRASVAYN